MRSRTGFVSRAPASLHRMSPAAAPDALPLLDAYRADHDVAALVARLEGLDAAGSLLTTAAPGEEHAASPTTPASPTSPAITMSAPRSAAARSGNPFIVPQLPIPRRGRPPPG